MGNILVMTVVLRINLNIDGTSIASKSHTHPSHSKTSRLLTSSPSLVFQSPRNPVYAQHGCPKEVYYESIKREPKIRGINTCRCDERLQTKTKEFTHLPYTGLVLELEHLKIETRLISERFANVMGQCEN